jgi:hypothetical protein
LCDGPLYASAQPLDFLARTKNPLFPDQKPIVSHPKFPDENQLDSIRKLLKMSVRAWWGLSRRLSYGFSARWRFIRKLLNTVGCPPVQRSVTDYEGLRGRPTMPLSILSGWKPDVTCTPGNAGRVQNLTWGAWRSAGSSVWKNGSGWNPNMLAKMLLGNTSTRFL